MRPHRLSLAFLILASGSVVAGDEKEQPFEQFRDEVVSLLAKLETDPKKQEAVEKQLRTDLAKIVEKYEETLRPKEGSKKYFSEDKKVVLVIAANGQDGKGGERALANEAEAKLVIAVAGNGSSAKDGKPATGGGAAIAQAPAGVALAIGGNGGEGGGGLGGGGGGACAAIGAIGGVSAGGNGGKGSKGEAGGLGACRVGMPEAVISAMKELKKQ